MKCDICNKKIEYCDGCGNKFEIDDDLICFDEEHYCSKGCLEEMKDMVEGEVVDDDYTPQI